MYIWKAAEVFLQTLDSCKLKIEFIMGFNIGIYSEQTTDNFECRHFIDRAFYNFVNSGEMYGEKSILLKSGEYYGLNLSSFLKLVYISEEVTDGYISANVQNTETLLDLVTNLRDKIEEDNSVCNNIDYIWYDYPIKFAQEDINNLIQQMGEEAARSILETIENQQKEIEENPNPWKGYFEQGQIIEDLNNIIKILKCYKEKGITKIFLTAG